MTAKRPRDPVTGLNAVGNGKGIGVHTRPVSKKRGASKDRTAIVPIVRRAKNTCTMDAAASVSPDKPLTDKQRAFVRLWAQGESITSASIRAGYNDGASIAYRMAKMPNVLALYEEEKRKYEESCQMTRKRVMEGLLEAVEMAKLMAEPASMVSGWREIAKMCGYYEPVAKKVDLTITANGFKRLERLSDEELLKLISTPAVLEAVEEAEDGE